MNLGTFHLALLLALTAKALGFTSAFTTYNPFSPFPRVAPPTTKSSHKVNPHGLQIDNPLGKSHAARTASKSSVFGTIEWSDLRYDDTSIAFDAWEWTNGMGAPAALVAAAVLVTLGETREETAPRKSDGNWARTLKRLMRFLLLTSFVLEVVSIFVGNMTGNMCLGHGPQEVAKKMAGYRAPLALLLHHHEFEFLTTQITFLQGLLNWLGAVTVELILPKPKETTSAKRLNKALAAWLISFTLWMLAFYNSHVNFYSDYASMLKRFFVLFWQKYFVETPFRPMLFLYGPSFLVSTFLTWRAFLTPREEDGDDGDVVSDRSI